MTSPDHILSLKTAKGAASAFTCWLANRYGAQNVFLWSPEESRSRGYGDCWTVCWEEGPYHWAPSLSSGLSVHAGETGSYSEVGPFPDCIIAKEWHAEPYNGFAMNFCKD